MLELVAGIVEAGESDAEVVLLAATALAAAGVTELSIDLNLPTLVAKVAAAGERASYGNGSLRIRARVLE